MGEPTEATMGTTGSVDEGARYKGSDGWSIDFPEGSACESIPSAGDAGKLKSETPKKAIAIFEETGAMPVYQEFVERLQSAHSTGMFATWKKADVTAIYQEMDPRFKECGVEVVICKRGFYNAGSKTGGEDWWFVYINRKTLADYEPEFKWSSVMGEESESAC